MKSNCGTNVFFGTFVTFGRHSVLRALWLRCKKWVFKKQNDKLFIWQFMLLPPTTIYPINFHYRLMSIFDNANWFFARSLILPLTPGGSALPSRDRYVSNPQFESFFLILWSWWSHILMQNFLGNSLCGTFSTIWCYEWWMVYGKWWQEFEKRTTYYYYSIVAYSSKMS